VPIAGEKQSSVCALMWSKPQGAQVCFKERKLHPQLQKSTAIRTECQLFLVMPALFVGELLLNVSARDSLRSYQRVAFLTYLDKWKRYGKKG
jgi:hypothetical protein